MFSFLLWLLLLFVFLFFVIFFFKLEIYVLIHFRLCGWMIDKTFFTRPISGNKTIFFLPKNQHFLITSFSRRVFESLNVLTEIGTMVVFGYMPRRIKFQINAEIKMISRLILLKLIWGKQNGWYAENIFFVVETMTIVFLN